MFEDPTSQSQRAARKGLGPREKDIADFIAYWQGKRVGSDLPRRADIDPRGIEPLLQYAFIAERIAPGLARLRIAGTHLSDLLGMEVRGMPVSAFVDPAHRDAFAGDIVDLFDRPARVELNIGSDAGIGRTELTGRIVMLPMRSDLGDVSRALGVLVTRGPLGRAPRRFQITKRRVIPIDLSHTPAMPPAAAVPAPAGLAEASAPFQGAGAPLSGERPYLRLVR